MQKIIKSIIVFLFIFVLLVFYNSLNRETNYSTDYLVGNKLANINLNEYVEAAKPYTWLTYPSILFFTIVFGFIYSVILGLLIKKKKSRL